jgi:hypothetical protein
MKTFNKIAAAAALMSLFTVPAMAGPNDLTVVELYTSEGCSSCPPADKFVTELAGRDDILALSLHVDYWDYIGWKDKFASPKYTARQRAYGQTMKLRYVYTPQVVVDGTYETVGSDRPKVMDAIAKAKAAEKVPVVLKESDDGMTAVLKATTEDVGRVDVYAVFYDRYRESDVRRGENSGRKLGSANVVRQLDRIATWQGDATTIKIPSGSSDAEVCAVILQSAKTGKIIGAARLALDGKS